MRKLITISLFFCALQLSYSQKTRPIYGDEAIGAAVTTSYTVGQLIHTNLTTASGLLYQTDEIAVTRAPSIIIKGDALVNTPPTFISTPTTSVYEGNTYTYQITTNDADGDDLTIIAATLPSWLSLDTAKIVSTLAGKSGDRKSVV